MSENKNIIILMTLATLVVIGGSYFYWSNLQTNQTVSATPTAPAIPTVPALEYEEAAQELKLREALFDPLIPVWNEATSDYRTNLNVSFEPTSAPLFLNVKVSFKNQNGEGVSQDTVDISQWANFGSIYRVRTFKYPGEYTFTIALKNNQGEVGGSLTLPTLIIK